VSEIAVWCVGIVIWYWIGEDAKDVDNGQSKDILG